MRGGRCAMGGGFRSRGFYSQPQQRQRNRQAYRAPQQPPAADPIEQYTFDVVTHDEIRALDIFPQVVDDLLSPGKAVCYLTQIITVADNQYRNIGEIQFEAKSVGNLWVGFLTINYPERRTFTCKHTNKKECKNLCSLAAVYHLRRNNNVDSRLKLNIDSSLTNSFIDNSRSPILLSPLSMSLKQQMMSFIGKFDECVANLLEYRIDQARRKYERLDFGGIEGKHAAILEGLEPDEGIVASSADKSNDFPNINGPIDLFTNRQFIQPDVRRKNQAFTQLKKVFSDRKQKFDRDDAFYDMAQAQERLPIRKLTNNIVDALKNHRAIVVAGDTGCGKSTQVPQIILEHFIDHEQNANSFVNVAITQPRRISAISLAERVALELGESSSGYTVGHNVRFDSKQPNRDLNIMTFFTTGMLLRKLQRNPDLLGVSHLVIDEVHERDCTTDFLLILIKRLLARRKDLRVILMSASMDAALFARYFDNCPIISIPGRCYPVTDQFLHDICRDMRVRMPRDEVKELARAPKLDLNLLTDLIRYIDDTRQPGAILCFMPGWKEMKAMQKELEVCRTQNKLRVLLAHSKLPISEQRLIFSKVGPRERKVILSTNIAETSLTINDVCYVIDTGLCNSIDYEPELNMSTFGTRWISKANAKQRSGRAGRTCPGECFKLYTRDEESFFQDYPFPELLRIPLESVIMEAKSHCPNEKAVTFLSQAIQHPSISAIHNALEELMLLGVLDYQETLTVLGKRISEFPTHPRLSVSLIVASALRCLYPILNTSAILSSTQEPFLTALTDKCYIRASKEKLCKEAIGPSVEPLMFMSDHIAFGNLLAQYDNSANSKHELEYFVEENNLNRSAMMNIQECRNLYARMMISSKFVDTYDWYSFDSMPNRNMNELELVVASLAYSFYPKVVRVIRGLIKNGRMYPNKVAPTDVQSNNKVRFASDSIVKNISLGKQLNSLVRDDQGGYESDEDSDYISMADYPDDRRPSFLTYLNSRLDQDSGQIVVRDGSVVPPLTLLLFGGRDLQVHEPNTHSGRNNNDQPVDANMVNITLDRHNLLTFKTTRDDATVIKSWRNVWQLYFSWYVHTRNISEPVDQNDSIISGTMNEFLELNKRLYGSISGSFLGSNNQQPSQQNRGFPAQFINNNNNNNSNFGNQLQPTTAIGANQNQNICATQFPQQQQLQQPSSHQFTQQANLNLANNHHQQQHYFSQQGLLAGAQLQAPANQQNFSKILLEGQQPASFQPPNQVIINDPYNINANQSIQHQQQQLQQQQYFNNNNIASTQQFQAPIAISQQNYPPFNNQAQQQQQHQLQFQAQNFHQNPTTRHFLPHQRSLPLPPPILQQLQARQQQQQLQRQYFQSANKLHFDDQRYYAGSIPLLNQPFNLYNNQTALSESPFYQQPTTRPLYYNPNHQQFKPTRRNRFNLESTRGFNHSLQSQWLYGGGGRRSMAGDLLLSGQASVIGDPLDADQKIVDEFCLLYDESRQLFNGLRNLPQIGHKGWQSHFETAFNAYTRLWRYQQQYRHILDSKYDLKRWQIGEIASKIAQLYYHYYLRTSDCSHLTEACNFYAAIRSRGYFNLLNKDVRASLVIKKLRYFARYIVVCLLMKRMKLVHELVREFSQSLNDYSHVYEPEAQLEWSLVLQEIKAFIDAESIVSVVSGPGHPDGQGIHLTLSQRLCSDNMPQPLKMPTGKYFLSEVLIVGNYQRQVRFSELTVDMYRLLQVLEREPNEQQQQQQLQQQQQQQQQLNTSPNHQLYGSSSQGKTFNLLARPTFNSQQGKGSPHKYLLFRPTFSQLFLFMASGFKELPQNGVILLYLSADGSFQSAYQQTTTADELGYDLGGVATNPTASSNGSSSANQKNQTTTSHTGSGMRGSQSMHFKQLNCIHPGDLYPFTRKPFVLIVDSNNSYAFQHMPRHFGLPLLVLMSPTDYPAPFNDNSKGSLFTLFLHCPITALCSISNIIELPETIWRDAQFYLDKFYTELGQILLQSRLLDPSYISLCSDDFLRLLIFRFIFCLMIMKLHRLFRTSNYSPRSYPALPEVELLQHPTLKQIISDMTVTLDIRTLFD